MKFEPKHAAVRPRVIDPETGEPAPLEQRIRAHLSRGTAGIIWVAGCPGAGKTTALRHLAAAFPAIPSLLLLDEPTIEVLREAALRGLVVYASGRQQHVPHVERLALAPWAEDEFIEYLLAVHGDRCGSVMERIRRANDRDLPEGIPALCAAALDVFASDETVGDISTAWRRHLQPHLTNSTIRQRVESAALSLQVYEHEFSEAEVRQLRSRGPNLAVEWVLRFPAVQRLLAAEAIVRALSSKMPCFFLSRTLAPDLVQFAARLIQSCDAARERLSREMANKNAQTQPTVASLLHAVDPQWQPGPAQIVRLVGAVLPGVSWPRAHMPRADLTAADLRGADLSGANLERTLVSDANLRSATMHGAWLDGCAAVRADLVQADLSFARCRSVMFACAKLNHANLEGSLLADAIFHRADLTGARLVRANLARTVFRGAAIDGADFSGADLEAAELAGLNLSVARFAGANFNRANLQQCNLEGMSLSAGNFERAKLAGALLTGSSIPSGCFEGADLRETGLADIDWERANLRKADLRGATFHMGSSRSGLVHSPIASEGTRTGFYTDEFDEQLYRAPEDIRKANLRGADLRGARIDNVDFYLVDLRDAIYDPRQADHFRRCGAILETRV